MAKTVTVGWNEFFTVPAVLKQEPSPTVRSIMFVVKTASITATILTLAPLIGTAVASALGVKAVSAVAVSSSFSSHAYVAGSGTLTVMAPLTHATAQQVGWLRLIKKILEIVDYLMDGVIIFSGISWMFGNRTKAIELLLGAGVGYVICRHYEDIKNFFALL